MKALQIICEVIFSNRREETARISSETIGLGYNKVLRYLAVFGIFYGASEVLYVINTLWLHWPGIAMSTMIGAFAVMFLCFIMIFIGPWSVAHCVVWAGMAMMTLTQLFVEMRWPRGAMEDVMIFAAPIVIILAVGYLYYMPAYRKWSQKALCWWIIGTQVVFLILTCVKWYYLNYVVDQFEPAIPYAFDSVHYMQINIWTKKVYVLGNGMAMLFSSVFLYYVVRQNSK